MDHITIYTDGSSKGNPGPGGFGAILMFGKHSKEISMGYRFTTNNRMELMAVLASLEALKKNDLPLTIHSDSQYVVKAINEGWLNNWIKTGFKGGKKNKDLWVKYFQLSKKFKIKIQWVK
ncbi:MAG TPA: ribonuclease HI, partial [Ferruginibacter sp.]|nr:ribonuclease HI [Ferruginibacter sp.]